MLLYSCGIAGEKENLPLSYYLPSYTVAIEREKDGYAVVEIPLSLTAHHINIINAVCDGPNGIVTIRLRELSEKASEDWTQPPSFTDAVFISAISYALKQSQMIYNRRRCRPVHIEFINEMEHMLKLEDWDMNKMEHYTFAMADNFSLLGLYALKEQIKNDEMQLTFYEVRARQYGMWVYERFVGAGDNLSL